MFELSTRDIIVLGAGFFLIAIGLAGLVPMLVHHRKALQGRLRIDESLNPALRAAAAAMSPAPPFVALRLAGLATTPVAVAEPPGAVEAPASRLDDRQVGPAEELLARLFTIRLMLSEVTEEVQALREAYLDEDVFEDIEQSSDHLSGIEQDADPEEALTEAMKPVKRLRKVRAAA